MYLNLRYLGWLRQAVVCHSISLWILLFLWEIVCGFVAWFWGFFHRYWFLGYLEALGFSGYLCFIAESEDVHLGPFNQVLHSSFFQKGKLLWNPWSASSQCPLYLEWESVCENWFFSQTCYMFRIIPVICNGFYLQSISI